MMTTPLRPLSPITHVLYHDAIEPGDHDPLPTAVRVRVTELLSQRTTAPEAEVDRIDAEIVSITSWYVLRPDEIARKAMALHHWRSPLTIAQATLVIAACAEAGYPIAGNGASDFRDQPEHQPVRGPERDRVFWEAARYWATLASQRYTYVSLGDRRGYMPRQVQYDQPGSMNPSQHAALTFGPADDDENSRSYMRRHCRWLIRVQGEE